MAWTIQQYIAVTFGSRRINMDTAVRAVIPAPDAARAAIWDGLLKHPIRSSRLERTSGQAQAQSPFDSNIRATFPHSGQTCLPSWMFEEVSSPTGSTFVMSGKYFLAKSSEP